MKKSRTKVFDGTPLPTFNIRVYTTIKILQAINFTSILR